MNERIKELYNKVFAESMNMRWNIEDAEKFAGLIVLECMEVFSKDLPEPGDGRMLEVINRVCNVAEHFGVEE